MNKIIIVVFNSTNNVIECAFMHNIHERALSDLFKNALER